MFMEFSLTYAKVFFFLKDHLDFHISHAPNFTSYQINVYDKIKEDCFCFHFVGMTTVGAARMHMCIQHRGLNSTRVGILVSACVFKSRPLGVSCDISTRYL